MYNSLPLSTGDMFQDPQWIPKNSGPNLMYTVVFPINIYL